MGDFYKDVQTILTIILLLILHFCFVMPHITRSWYIFYKGRGQIYNLEAKKIFQSKPLGGGGEWKNYRGEGHEFCTSYYHNYHKPLNMSLLLTIYLKKSVYNEIYIYTYK